jgi:hypothetical protein
MALAPAERPSDVFGPERLEMMRALPDLVIAAIAGRDSVAAAVAACREEGFSAVLPTVVLTGTEFGDPDAPLAAVQLLRDLLDGEADVLDPMRFGSPALWAALNGRFASELGDRYHVSSPCLACHLYVHLARVPLSWSLGSIPVVTGERDTHDGRVKLSQTRASIDAETRVLAHAGVELLTPVRERPGAEIDVLVGGKWTGQDDGWGCVHSGNYVRLDGSAQFDSVGYLRYVSEFLEPCGMAVVDAWRSSAVAGIPDYEAIVRGVLES